MPERPGILFTAFEPSGDEHAAGAIAELRRLRPDIPIYALGGPRMAEAGAELIETTTQRSAMGAGALGKITEQLALRRRLKRWLADHPIAVHVPTDSPAANWAICRIVKRTDAAAPALPNQKSKIKNQKSTTQVVHLVAPQVWAWASWRVRRLQRWSDRVLCVLPFEPAWFAERGVEAQFIGHPLLDRPLDEAMLDRIAADYPDASPKVALLPGSRMGEIAANWPVMRDTFERLARRFDRAQGLIAAADAPGAERIRAITPRLPDNLRIVVGQTDAALRWADVALTASGTATLHVARHHTPMAILYAVPPLMWHALGRWLVNTRTFTLPNLIAAGGPHRERGRHIVREFVPWPGGDVGPIVEELAALVEDGAKRERQVEALRRVVAAFEGHQAGRNAAEAILDLAERGVR